MVLRVKILRIEAFPPQALPLSLGHDAVVRHARQRAGRVGALGVLIPAPGAVAVTGDRKTQPCFAGRLHPAADNVLLWPDLHAVPRLIRRVEHVHVVMVVGHRPEELRAGALVEGDELLRLPLVGLPFVDHVLEAELRRVAVFLAMEFVVGAVELIHFLRIPVAHLGLALRTPMRPDAKLHVAVPVGHLVVGERFPRRLKWPGRDAEAGRRGNVRWRGGQGARGGRDVGG